MNDDDVLKFGVVWGCVFLVWVHFFRYCIVLETGIWVLGVKGSVNVIELRCLVH